jgi:hypothetical protein
MNKLIKKIIIFILPIIAYCFLVILIDPFNYFSLFNDISNKVKLKIAYPNNELLWKCAEFKNVPCNNILLGDSRTDAIDVSKIEKLAVEKYYNFAYGGATPSEIVDTFWYAARLAKLNKVYIGINFDAYNKFNCMNRFPEMESIMRNPLLYLVNTSVLRSECYIIKSLLTGRSIVLSNKPTVSRDQFWQDQLEHSRNAINGKYLHPDNLYDNLKKIKTFCQDNKIELTFIVLPTHLDMQERITRFNLTLEHNRFYGDLHGLGKTFNFDYPNNLTQNKNNYEDPYHLKNTDIIINDVWGQSPPSIAQLYLR